MNEPYQIPDGIFNGRGGFPRSETNPHHAAVKASLPYMRFCVQNEQMLLNRAACESHKLIIRKRIASYKPYVLAGLLSGEFEEP